jgi:SAM-dependent methyltransferase
MSKKATQQKRFWDTLWTDKRSRDFWTKVSPEVLDLIQRFPVGTYPDVLDLGCGLGRNSIELARAGYNVTATDLSSKAVAYLVDWANKLNLKLRTHVCNFVDNIFPSESFDIVVSENVIYHGLPEQFANVIANVRSWLKQKGVFYFTCPTLADGLYGCGKELALHTYELEKGHTHFHTDEAHLREILSGYKLSSLKKRDHHWENGGVACFSSRWQILVEKR